ncbi:MAG: hypothetical protein OEM51_01720 [Gammaproteobacteria bacterium]|nr:hypothetical protein [Gammaproteobacteria bacterium]
MDSKTSTWFWKSMRRAGADAYNMGKPCVPGLDILWVREAHSPNGRYAGWAMALAKWWRNGWQDQAALVDKIRGWQDQAALDDRGAR